MPLPRSAPRRRTALLLAVAFTVAACSSGSAPMTTGADDAGAGAEETGLTTLTGGDPLPAFDLPLLLDPSTTVATASWQGQPTVVNFWATWCAFCVEEMPDIQSVSEALEGEVRFVGVDRSIADQDAIDFVEAAGVTYDLVKDTGTRGDDFFFATQARGMPTTLFVDADGIIQHRWAGPLSEEQLRDLIEEHLGV